MTTIYFVRHCEPNYDNHDDQLRELTDKGLQDRQLLCDYFENKEIDAIQSSPYKRAMDTIAPVAEAMSLAITIVDEFRERKIDSVWIEDFTRFTQKQWQDFHYKLSDGESLHEVQNRNIVALKKLVATYPGKSVIVSSHGTAISTVINYYDSRFGYKEFEHLKSVMPFVVELRISEDKCVSITYENLHTGERNELYSI